MCRLDYRKLIKSQFARCFVLVLALINLPTLSTLVAQTQKCADVETETCDSCLRRVKFAPRNNWFTSGLPVRSRTYAREDCTFLNQEPTFSEPGPFIFDRSTLFRTRTKPEENAPPQQPVGGDAQELAKKLSNPIASLISVPFQSNFDFNMGTGSGWRYTLNIQPVVPIELNAKWNVISRTILPIIHQHNVVNTSSQSGLGDITQSFFFAPTDSKRFIWGAGPVVLIPTATNDLLGTEKFGLGPTLLILKQEHAWTYGFLTNHIWSVAGSDSRASVNSTFIQPFLAYNTKDAWTFGLNTESSYDWVGNAWTVPIHFSVSKLIKFGHQPISVGGTLRCWATSPAGGPENCGFRFIVTPLFPK